MKIDTKNMLSQRINNNEFKFKLITERDEQNKILGIVNNYIPFFMRQLWESPKSIATILLKSERTEIKKYLAFITHNLYDNISSLNHKDDQLIYIITLLLKEEFKSLKSIKNYYFSDRCGMILEELSKKKDLKLFFKTVVLEIIKKIENDYSNKDIIFEPSKIKMKIAKLNKYEKEHNIKENNDKNNNKCNNEDDQNNNYNNNNIFLNFNKNKLEQKLSDTKDKDMKDFLRNIIDDCAIFPDKYSNNNLLNNIYKEAPDNLDDIINYYNISFKQTADIIDMLFENLLNKSDCLPYYIKCICKIISILIEKKYPKAIRVEKNKFLVYFFFHNLFFPTLIKPSLNFFINEIIISDSTINKFQIILTILNNMTLGELFESDCFTPFNWYIVEKIPKLIKFFDNICQINLPPFIEKLINDELF